MSRLLLPYCFWNPYTPFVPLLGFFCTLHSIHLLFSFSLCMARILIELESSIASEALALFIFFLCSVTNSSLLTQHSLFSIFVFWSKAYHHKSSSVAVIMHDERPFYGYFQCIYLNLSVHHKFVLFELCSFAPLHILEDRYKTRRSFMHAHLWHPVLACHEVSFHERHYKQPHSNEQVLYILNIEEVPTRRQTKSSLVSSKEVLSVVLFPLYQTKPMNECKRNVNTKVSK